MNMIHINRLKRLHDIIANIPHQQIDVRWWRASDGDGTSGVGVECGTVCCFGGWASFDPVFNSEGLSRYPESAVPTLTPAGADVPAASGYEALQYFFGLTVKDTDRLFAPMAYFDASIDTDDQSAVKAEFLRRISAIISAFTVLAGNNEIPEEA